MEGGGRGAPTGREKKEREESPRRRTLRINESTAITTCITDRWKWRRQWQRSDPVFLYVHIWHFCLSLSLPLRSRLFVSGLLCLCLSLSRAHKQTHAYAHTHARARKHTHTHTPPHTWQQPFCDRSAISLAL